MALHTTVSMSGSGGGRDPAHNCVLCNCEQLVLSCVEYWPTILRVVKQSFKFKLLMCFLHHTGTDLSLSENRLVSGVHCVIERDGDGSTWIEDKRQGICYVII